MNASSLTTVSKWLRNATAALTTAVIDTARLDALVLLGDELGRDKGWLLAHPEYELQRSMIKKLNTKVVQRTQHTPLAYIRGKAEFYGREFAVNAHTLVPRPETETAIELLKAIKPATILDVGTGSGAIAITAALELPETRVYASDISKKALKTARQNAKQLGATITFYKANLLHKAPPVDTVVANLPYVPVGFPINRAATHEPALALYGGKDGLDLYRALFHQLNSGKINLVDKVITESLPEQHRALARIAKTAGYALTRTDDFWQVFSLTS